MTLIVPTANALLKINLLLRYIWKDTPQNLIVLNNLNMIYLIVKDQFVFSDAANSFPPTIFSRLCSASNEQEKLVRALSIIGHQSSKGASQRGRGFPPEADRLLADKSHYPTAIKTIPVINSNGEIIFF